MKDPEVQLVLENADEPNSDRREHFRMQEHACLTYTILDGSGVDEAVPGLGDLHEVCGKFASMTGELERTAIKTRPGNPELTAAIQCVNKKIDVLANMLLQQEMMGHEAPAQLICISAGGLAFLGPEHLEPGTRLYLRFTLSESMTAIGAEAAVCRIERRAGVLSQNPYRIAAEFVGLRDSQTDLIVRHLLRSQAARIRKVDDECA